MKSPGCARAFPHDRRTPHGVRGLKFRLGSAAARARLSHPARGAWIEIDELTIDRIDNDVAPRTGCVD